MESWVNELTIDDLDEKNKEMAKIIGMEKFLDLCKFYGGDRFYFNKLDDLIRVTRDRKIKEEYNGYNSRALALKYNLTTERIKQIVRDNSMKEQMSMFDR